MELLCTLALMLGLSGCEPPLPEDIARDMMDRVAASEPFAAIPQTCPLAVYGTRTPVPAPVPDCAAAPDTCLSLCAAGSRDACFDAASVIEQGDIPLDSHRTYPLFMSACMLGLPNACVNAGATVKNGQWPEGTPRPEAAAAPKCQFETYDRMCDDGAAWGCYMVAQEYRWGGYAAQDEARYQAKMQQACLLEPTGGACLDQFR